MIYCIFVILLQSVFVTRSERFWCPVETNMLGAEKRIKKLLHVHKFVLSVLFQKIQMTREMKLGNCLYLNLQINELK